MEGPLKRPPLVRWVRGEELDHRKLNQPIDAIEDLRGGVGIPYQRRGRRASGAVSQDFRERQMQIVGVFEDYFTAVDWDGEEAGTYLYYVAKPWMLRQSPFDGQTRAGLSYSYTGIDERTASDGAGGTEDQLIVPSYEAGDIVKAKTPIINGTGVTRTDEQGATVEVIWEESGPMRIWMKES